MDPKFSLYNLCNIILTDLELLTLIIHRKDIYTGVCDQKKKSN